MLTIINNNIVDVNTISGYWFVVTDKGVTEGLSREQAIRIAEGTNLLATDHKTYQDYVDYTRSKGFCCFGEDLWDALKKQDDEIRAKGRRK